MTTSTFCLLAVGMLSAGTLAAQSPSDSESLKLLRQTIADQKRYPNKVIRTYTNLPPAEVKNTAPAAEPAPVTVAQSKPAPSKPAAESKPAAPTGLSPAEKKAAAAELEKQFLNGKLSARQYQKALADLDNPAKAAQAVSKAKPPSGSGNVAPAVTPAPPSTPAQTPASHQRVSEVEARIDEMIRKKEAREQAAKTNATNATPAPGIKMSKRERLDFLLRQVVDGKLSDAEYKKEREKILAEPE